ncbi:dihydrodipicolinate synthase family protein [Providencia rettgeri]|uniref:dihydrodipicolinate synthase family protein n=1 Tax=Providencia rettgeri TaxID=587 RepID=UPI001C5813C3|nr:dihydrodipicolinate synthase family protein [Providencia rettgeri]MBW3104365.1 dihydrodipicolinate synthase family protein [Providencia rettgeri]
MTHFHGIFPYLVSPVDQTKGTVLESSLRHLIEHLISSGVHGLSPLGSTGEYAYLSQELRNEVVRITVDQAAGRVPVLAGGASFSTSDACFQAEQYANLGVDGMVLISQKMYPLSDKAQLGYFQTIAESFPEKSMTVYTNPGLLGDVLSISLLNELSYIPNIEYVKDASSNTGRLLTMLNTFGERVKIFSASAHIPLLVIKLGGVGWMAGPACVLPKQCVELYELATRGDWDTALAKQKEMWQINEAFTQYALASCIKASLNIQGFNVGDPILPQEPLNDVAIAHLQQIIAQLNE